MLCEHPRLRQQALISNLIFPVAGRCIRNPLYIRSESGFSSSTCPAIRPAFSTKIIEYLCKIKAKDKAFAWAFCAELYEVGRNQMQTRSKNP